MYVCVYCRRSFHNVLWKTEQNEPVCIDCAVRQKEPATFSPDDREVPKTADSEN